jgi:hypothetical protein
MRSALAAAFLLAVCVPAFAKDEYVVAHIQCPMNVFAVVNFVDKAGSDPQFHVDHDGPHVDLLPKSIGRTDQVITCSYAKPDAMSDNVFKVTYSYKVKRTILSCTSASGPYGGTPALDCKLKP